jgi:hypothetical protein
MSFIINKRYYTNILTNKNSKSILFSSVIGSIPYYIINKVLNQYQNSKLALNSTSFLHASTAILISLIGNVKLMRINTGGYFLFDILYLIKNKKINLMNCVYIYHHIAGLYYMSLDPQIYNWVKIIGWSEISNMPNYIVYYYLKKGITTNIIFWKKIQLIWYGFMRIIVLSYLSYNELNNKIIRKKLYPVIPLYIFGLLWSGTMIKQNIDIYLNTLKN